VCPGRVYRLSTHVSQTMFTENSTHVDEMNRVIVYTRAPISRMKSISDRDSA